MKPHIPGLLVASVLFVMACGGKDAPTGPTEDDTPPPVATVASVTVTPSTAALTFLGQTAQLNASAQDASGNGISGKTFTWSSSDANVATVSTNGLVTAVADGSVTITASTDGINGAAAVDVDQVIDFESYPDGSPACQGCPLSIEFSSLGVLFRGESTASVCTSSRTKWHFVDTAIYDVAGAPPNHAAANDCSVGTWFVELQAEPALVQFEATVNDQEPVLLSARDGAGQPIPASSISRSLSTYTSRNGVLFRVETIQIVSPAGVSEFWFDTSFYAIFLDNLRIN